MPDIFMSYAREDETRIKGLVSALEEHGWSVFWDRRIPAGETWRSYIGTALDMARCILVAWSQHSTNSEWVAEEADEGKKRGILVPLLLDRVQPPRGFREIQAADLTDWQPGQPSQHLDQLFADVARCLERTNGLQPKVRQDDRRDESKRNKPSSNPRMIAKALVSLVALVTIGYIGFKAMQPGTKPPPYVATQPSLKPPPVNTQPSPESPPYIPAQPTSPESPKVKSQWLVIAGSFAATDSRGAEQRRLALTREGWQAITVDTNEYPLLRPDLKVVVVGPFESQAQASAILAKVKDVVPDAYVKKGR